MRDQETETALEEAEIRNLELQLQKKMFEQVILQFCDYRIAGKFRGRKFSRFKGKSV